VSPGLNQAPVPRTHGRVRFSRWLSFSALALLLVACGVEQPDAETREGDDRGSLSNEDVEPGTPEAPDTGDDTETRGGTALREVPAELRRAMSERGPAVATSPRQLARQLEAAETTLADRDALPEQVAAAGHLQQVAYLELGARPGWDDRVRAALPASLHRVLADNLASRREFIALHGGTRSTTLPAWRIIEPAPAAELRRYYAQAERRFGVDWNYLAAINLIETGMGRIEGFSVAGARGPMQFIPETWAAYGRGDIDDPRDAIMAAARYLSARGFNEPGGRADALFAYNNARTYVRGVTLLAELMERRPGAFAGYYHWQIYYQTDRGSVRLPQGYAERRTVPVRRWLGTAEGRSGLPLRAVS
jgi:hypothetical protein